MSHALFALLLPACTAVGGTAPEAPAASEPTASAHWSFDDAPTKAPPPGFESAQTGDGAPGRWVVLERWRRREAPAARVARRLLAEADAPQADVFWSGDPIRPFLLAQRGLLEAYASPEAAGIPAAYKAADGSWTGVAARARMLLLTSW
jgi:hypothetical protein